MTARVPVWDAPTRLFHWAIAVLVVFSFVTGTLGGGWMAWHLKSGYAILALLIFRIAWGFIGSPTSRFARFLRGPRAAIDYARATLAGHHPHAPGHNPLGGWMVVFMIGVLLLQAATGLFADDEISTQGPLSILASAKLVSQVNQIHEWNKWLIVGAVCLHVIAIASYQFGLKVNLVGPMLHGGDAPNLPAPASNVLAAVAFAIACAAVYYLVVIFPRSQ